MTAVVATVAAVAFSTFQQMHWMDVVTWIVRVVGIVVKVHVLLFDGVTPVVVFVLKFLIVASDHPFQFLRRAP